MSEEKNRSNWWYLLPVLFSIIGGLISYFAIKQDDPMKAKYCLCVGLLLSFGLIGGIVGYFILRKDNYEKAKIFLYLGIIITAINLASYVLIAEQIGQIEPNFGLDINV